MGLIVAARACAVLILCVIHSGKADENISKVNIQAFKPKGLRVSLPSNFSCWRCYIPDLLYLNHFAFHGNINESVNSYEIGTIFGAVLSPTNGRWVIDLPDVTLNKGDVIRYYLFVSVGKTGYVIDDQEFTIRNLSYLNYFAFQGNVNESINSNQEGTISGEVFSPTNGRWVIDLPDVTLNKGDVIRYYLFVSVGKTGYVIDDQEFTIRNLEEYVPLPGPDAGSPAPAQPACTPTLTKLRVGTACAGQTIFEEHFNYNTLNESLWQIEHYIPVAHPEIPFVSYQRSQVSVVDGNLRVAADLQQNHPGWSNNSIINGSLDLFQGCTSNSSSACSMRAVGTNIVPPVISGRVTSKPDFAFTYGTISVRAKLPQGDWLYPEILLEPLVKKYGFGTLNYKSGVVRIANARGNKELNWERFHIGNKLLYAGPIIEEKCRDALYANKISETFWGDDFHVYSVRWTPERITVLVDDVELGHVEPRANGLRGNLPMTCRVGDEPDQQGMAPFDDHFYVTLGLAAGGFTEFPNNVKTTGDRTKPWRNEASKAMLNFWQDHPAWHATWQHPELLVDYVKVVAL